MKAIEQGEKGVFWASWFWLGLPTMGINEFEEIIKSSAARNTMIAIVRSRLKIRSSESLVIAEQREAFRCEHG